MRSQIKPHLLNGRETEEYEQAIILLNEKRQLYERLAEVNQALRVLVKANPEAVHAARADATPFRNLPGRRV